MRKDELTALLAHFKLKPDKAFGQNYLLDDDVLDRMVRAAGVGPSDTVLEIGPGIGNLTERLAQRAKKVIAVEKDLRLRELLTSKEAAYPNLQVFFSDILRFDFESQLQDGGEYKIVANIPYYVTGKIIQTFLRAKHRPQSITVLVQKEVAQNMVALPGRTNLLSLSVRLVGNPVLVGVVPARSFFPAPKVDSAVIHIDIPEDPPYAVEDEKTFFRIARFCFSGKRKQIHNTLKAGLQRTNDEVVELLTRSSIEATVRPQDLSVEQFIRLTETAKALGFV